MFCGKCKVNVIISFSNINEQIKRDEWRVSCAKQYAYWKDTIVSAAGVGVSIGTAIGGATATVANTTFGLVKGVTTAITNKNQVPPKSLTNSVRRSRSEGPNRTEDALVPPVGSEDFCVACHTENRGHKAHINRGNCMGHQVEHFINQPLTDQMDLYKLQKFQVFPFQDRQEGVHSNLLKGGNLKTLEPEDQKKFHLHLRLRPVRETGRLSRWPRSKPPPFLLKTSNPLSSRMKQTFF